jgi:hypothetical protein
MTTASPLLALCGELRNRIYLYCFAGHDPAAVPTSISRSPLALSLTCRQLYAETYPLAFAATPLYMHRWQHPELIERVQRIPESLRPVIKRLQLSIAISDFLVNPHSLEGLRFADAGLSEVEELCIVFSGQHQSGKLRESYIRSNLEVVLLKTVADCKNDHLTKIQIIHENGFRWTGAMDLYSMMRKRLHSTGYVWAQPWEAKLNYPGSGFQLIGTQKDKAERRVVSISMERIVD